MLTPADKAGGSVAGAREDPGALIGPGSLSPNGWIYRGLGARHPALIQRRGGPSGSLQESHQGQEIAGLARKAPQERG
jgi:hypothetical protein